MKTGKLITIVPLYVAIFLLIVFPAGTVLSQEPVTTDDSLSVSAQELDISDIPSEIITLSNHLLEISEFLQKEEKIINNDLIVRENILSLEERKKEFINTMPSMTYQRLENEIQSIHNLKNKFKTIQETLVGRINEEETVKNELMEELHRWERKSEVLDQGDYPMELGQYADTAKLALWQILAEIDERADTLLLIRSKQAQLNLLIDDLARLMEGEMVEFQSNYFITDSKPIWGVSDSITLNINPFSYFKDEFSESFSVLKTYLRSNKATVIIQMVFILLLIVGFILVRKVWPTHELDPKSKRETHAGYIMAHPFFSSLLIGIMISIFFYANRPPLLGDLFIIIMMISALVLLPGLLTKKMRTPLIILLILYLLAAIQANLYSQLLVNRIIIMIQSLSILGLIYITYQRIDEFQLTGLGKRMITGFIWVFGILMIIAFITNLLGIVKLSDFLIQSTVGILTFSVIVVTVVIILNSMIIILIKGKKAQSIPLYDQLKKSIDKRIRPIINWGAFALWLYAALIYYRLWNPFKNVIGKIMDTEFSIASVAISIGAIISFILIVLFTYVIVSFVKNIFKDEWVTKSRLPRGTADALSMLIRYTIVAFGVYLALTSIGLDMNKFGFIAGALGVGIGFGLQNVVLNFIAGLILSFEKPIHVGDVIEVDQEMGKVTEIGVRASKVLTWNGSEAIIPNGVLISNKVVNWTLANEKRRLEISVKTPFDADPEKVIEILTKVAGEHPNTHAEPSPMAVFNGYESYAFDFTLYCWVRFNVSFTTKSDIAIEIFKSLAAAGIEAPLPSQKIKIDPDSKNNSQ